MHQDEIRCAGCEAQTALKKLFLKVGKTITVHLSRSPEVFLISERCERRCLRHPIGIEGRADSLHGRRHFCRSQRVAQPEARKSISLRECSEHHDSSPLPEVLQT